MYKILKNLNKKNLYLKSRILNNKIYKFIKFFYEYIVWKKSNFNKYQIPQKIKENFLLNNSLKNSIWIETGTYLGVTSNVLKKTATKLYTIEANRKLYKNYHKMFSKDKNVVALCGQSPKFLKKILPLMNTNINFFLDAHTVNNSKTLTYKNKRITLPLEDELKIIFKYMKNFKKFTIFIDDIALLGEKKIDELITNCKNLKFKTKFFFNILLIRN